MVDSIKLFLNVIQWLLNIFGLNVHEQRVSTENESGKPAVVSMHFTSMPKVRQAAASIIDRLHYIPACEPHPDRYSDSSRRGDESENC